MGLVEKLLAGRKVRDLLLESSPRFDTIKSHLLSSGFSDDRLILTKEEEQELVKTLIDIKVYRGVSVLRQRVTSQQYKELCDLRPGDVVPEFIAVNNKNRFTSATTKLSVAKHYVSGGNVSLVLQAESNKSNTWVNLKNLIKTDLAKEFDEDDLQYFKSSGEVLMKPNTEWKVLEIKIHK